MALDHVIMRDSLTLNQGLVQHLERLVAARDIKKTSTVGLCARILRVEGAVSIDGWHLLLIADHIDGRAGTLELQPAGPRIDGMDVTVLCRTALGISAVLPGRTGPSGAPGEPGIPGTDGPQDGEIHQGDCSGMLARDCPDLDSARRSLVGGLGGPGGQGGQGGQGGRGGTVRLRHVDAAADSGQVHLAAPGGPGGPGGSGGRGGVGGDGGTATVFWSRHGVEDQAAVAGPRGPGGASGAQGPQGEAGLPGTVDALQIDEEQMWTAIGTALGEGAPKWARHRLAVAQYFHRAANPVVPPREGYLAIAIAMAEVAAALRLEPTSPEALRTQQRMLTGQTALGLPRDLDITPDFASYIRAFTQWGTPVFGALQDGVETLLRATEHRTVADRLALDGQQIDATIATTAIERAAARIRVEAAQKDKEVAKARVEDLRQRVAAALAEMENRTVDIGGVVGAIAAVAAAVVSVIAAIPTGGTSLIALVPSLTALTATVVQSAPAIVGELFSSDKKHLEEVKAAYAAVDKDKVKSVIEAGKAIVSLVDAVQKLAKAVTQDPDDTKHVELVRAAVEATHISLLADLRAEQADLHFQAAATKADRATALRDKLTALLQTSTASAAVLRQGALDLIEVAQLQRDDLLGFGFMAQRSVEIFTLRDQTANLFLDSGFIHPDLERDFLDGLATEAQLATAYQLSWARFLSPVRMEADYLDYFSAPSGNLDVDIRRLSFTDPALLAEFAENLQFDLQLELTDLPSNHREAKIQEVAVAFPGATSPSGVVSCEVAHGPAYSQLRLDGTPVTQVLRPHLATRKAPTTRLVLDGVETKPGNALTAPQALSLWGRGAAGSWRISVMPEEIRLHDVDVSTITEIQLWIVYQFRK